MAPGEGEGRAPRAHTMASSAVAGGAARSARAFVGSSAARTRRAPTATRHRVPGRQKAKERKAKEKAARDSRGFVTYEFPDKEVRRREGEARAPPGAPVLRAPAPHASRTPAPRRCSCLRR